MTADRHGAVLKTACARVRPLMAYPRVRDPPRWRLRPTPPSRRSQRKLETFLEILSVQRRVSDVDRSPNGSWKPETFLEILEVQDYLRVVVWKFWQREVCAVPDIQVALDR